eukprot:6192385-Karenia_brevis.AAC.1
MEFDQRLRPLGEAAAALADASQEEDHPLPESPGVLCAICLDDVDQTDAIQWPHCRHTFHA